MKSRGMAHSNQVREFHITANGIDLIPPYIGPAGVLTGSARYAQESREKAEEVARAEEIKRSKQLMEQQQKMFDAKIEALRVELDDKKADLERKISEEERRKEVLENNRRHLKALRTSSGKEMGR